MDKKGKKIVVYFVYALLFVILAGAAALIFPGYRKNQRIKAHVEKLSLELDNKKAEAVRLNQEVYDLKKNPEAIEKIAREKYGMCKPGETILKYEDESK